MIPQTADEKTVLDLTNEQLQEIADTLRNLKGNGFSTPITSIKLTYPGKTSTVVAWNPATRGREDFKMATFYSAGQGGGQLARTLQLAVQYLDLLPVAVAMLKRQHQEDAHELECVVAVLDAKGVPAIMGQDTTTGEDVPYTVHGRVAAALEAADTPGSQR